MLSFYDAAALAAAPDAVPDARLHRILSHAVPYWTAVGVLDLTHLLVVQAGDTEAALVAEIGFSPLANPIDRAPFGSPAFRPFWDLLQDHAGWFEMTVTVGNSGFAFVLFIHDAEGVDPQLLKLCRTYAGDAACTGL
ncbi:MAG TPA: hypothetical protein VF655_13785 [Allosphingosinicella sp.]|jgi:hypothetical protein